MNTKLALTILMLAASLAGAQEKMTDRLRQAIVEEEANQNLDKAIQAYQGILAQFDQERQTAAAALFHLAGCYRKQGKNDQAIAAYKRVVRDFPDQSKLADSSRTYLTKTFGLSEGQAATPGTAELAEARQRYDARQRYKAALLQEIQLVEEQIEMMQRKVEVGTISASGPEITGTRLQLLELQRTLAAFDAGALPIPKAINK